MKCPSCSQAAWRNGFRAVDTNGRTIRQQIWKCSSCSRQFTLRSMSIFSRMRFPKKTVQTALKLHFEHGLSCYSISNLLASKGEKVSHVSVYKWIKKYEPLREQFMHAQAVREVKSAMMERAAQ